MATMRKARCSQCGKELRTVAFAAPVKRAPIICRHCFGERSYQGGSRWLTPSVTEVAAGEVL